MDANKLPPLQQIAAEMENFAAVADHCTITEVVNSIPAMRAWAERLRELSALASLPAGEPVAYRLTNPRSGYATNWEGFPLSAMDETRLTNGYSIEYAYSLTTPTAEAARVEGECPACGGGPTTWKCDGTAECKAATTPPAPLAGQGGEVATVGYIDPEAAFMLPKAGECVLSSHVVMVREPHGKYTMPLFDRPTPPAASTQGEEISADEVQWVVNDNAELGVKIGGRFFFLYKGYSLAYEDGKHDDGSPMHWRPVFKREFGECCHPVNYADLRECRYPHRIGTVSLTDSEEWQPLPAAPSPAAAGGENGNG